MTSHHPSRAAVSFPVKVCQSPLKQQNYLNYHCLMPQLVLRQTNSMDMCWNCYVVFFLIKPTQASSQPLPAYQHQGRWQEWCCTHSYWPFLLHNPKCRDMNIKLEMQLSSFLHPKICSPMHFYLLLDWDILLLENQDLV